MTRLLVTVHLIGAAVWLGGLITLGALVPVLSRAGVARPQLQAMARQFGRVSWGSMGLLIASGGMLVWRTDRQWGDLSLKLGLVTAAITFALIHQLTARNSTPAQRGVVQALILLASLGIFYTATGI